MAKKDEKAKSATVELTEENVMENIKSGNLMKSDNVKKALENIEKEKDEQQQNKIQTMICTAEYRRAKSLIELRARRREEKITKNTLKENEALLNKVLAGEITPTEYDTERDKIKKEEEKQFSESKKQSVADMKELRDSFVGKYAYRVDWDW